MFPASTSTDTSCLSHSYRSNSIHPPSMYRCIHPPHPHSLVILTSIINQTDLIIGSPSPTPSHINHHNHSYQLQPVSSTLSSFTPLNHHKDRQRNKDWNVVRNQRQRSTIVWDDAETVASLHLHPGAPRQKRIRKLNKWNWYSSINNYTFRITKWSKMQFQINWFHR